MSKKIVLSCLFSTFLLGDQVNADPYSAMLDTQTDVASSMNNASAVAATPVGDTPLANNPTRSMGWRLPWQHYVIGQQAFGGTIVYVDNSHRHGVILSNTDVMYENIALFPWATGPNASYQSYANAATLFGGQTNTSSILAMIAAGFYGPTQPITPGSPPAAAYVCSVYTSPTDPEQASGWILPTVGDLMAGCNVRNARPFQPLNAPFYWTSTQTAAQPNGPGTAFPINQINVLSPGVCEVTTQSQATLTYPIRCAKYF